MRPDLKQGKSVKAGAGGPVHVKARLARACPIGSAYVKTGPPVRVDPMRPGSSPNGGDALAWLRER
jgi:hypothetical protein